MSLDGFIAGLGHSLDWGGGRALADFVAPDDVAEVAAATGAMLVGRRTWEVGDRMEAEEPGSTDYPECGGRSPTLSSDQLGSLAPGDPLGGHVGLIPARRKTETQVLLTVTRSALRMGGC